MTLVVGIDPSSKKIATVAYVDEPRLVRAHSYVLLKPSQRQDIPSLGRAMVAMQHFVQWADQVCPDGERIAWVELPLVGHRAGPASTIKQAYVGGVIRGALSQAGFKVYDIGVSTWKKEIVGNGLAKKPAVAQAIFQRAPKVRHMIEGDEDLVDAAAIAEYGLLIEKQRSLTRQP